MSCQASATECVGNGVRTCDNNGQWGVAVPCGSHQTCTGSIGSGRCTCIVDATCTVVGNVCAGTTSLTTCSRDPQACLYPSSQAPCSNGACSGAPGAGSCCTNACSTGTTQCASGMSLQSCAVAANGCTDWTASSCSTGSVCERHAPAACVDPGWAEWPMPNGQADVTAGAPNLGSYTDNGNGTVTDNVTGLMWQQAVPASTFGWSAAVAFCPTLTLAGHNDWRLPSLIELVSIVDFGRSSPSIDGTYFPATPVTGVFWSSTPAMAGIYISLAWAVDFTNGSSDKFDASLLYHPVRCVR